MSKEIQVKTIDEALRLLRGAGRVYVHCRIDAGIEGDDKHYIPDFYVAGLRVTKASAVAYLRDAFSHRRETATPSPTMRMSVRVDAQTDRYCTKRREMVPRKPVKTVWIG